MSSTARRKNSRACPFFAANPLCNLITLLLLMVSMFAALPALGAEKETLRVQPDQVTLPLNHSIAFIAAFPAHPGKSAASRRVIWSAYNLTTRQAGSISPEGVFTPSVAGEYQITAKAGDAEAHASIHVLPGVAAASDKTPLGIIQVSSRAIGGESAGNLQQAPITGRGWRDDYFRMAFQIRNRRGHDPLRRYLKNRPLLRNVDAGGGDRNFLLTIPIIKLPGRGQDLSLNLFYNSNVWLKTIEDEGDPGNSKLVTHMIFDYDHGWPAPGWSLGLGKIVYMGSSGSGAVQDSDGTLHPFEGQVQTFPHHSVFQGHSTDGSLLDYSNDSDGAVSVQYPNGTTVAYGAYDGSSRYPIMATDANGNFIIIVYVNNKGPAIQAIQDTLGRIVNFQYDSSNRLIAVTAPGLNGSTRTVVRFHYSSAGLARFGFGIETNFGDLDATNPKEVQQIDGIYFPGSATGYWFGDTDSYSYYGMIAKVSERRGMTLQASSLNNQGTLSPGIVTRDRVYNYPLQRTALKDAPTYDTMTESWAGMTVPPAVTHYSVQLDTNPRRIDTVYPDGAQTMQLMYNHPGKFDDNLLFQTITSDASGKLLRQASTTWELGDYSSPRVSATQISDELGQTITTQYSYQSSTNSLSEVRQLDYDGTTVLRRTHTEYETDPAYANRHIFNLPKAISLFGADGRLASLTEYSYDHQPLTNAPFVVGHSGDANPFGEVYDPQTDYRGNVTQVIRHIDETRSAIEARRYDITGNLISRSGPCCEQTNISYSLDTQYAYPSSINRGATDPASLLRLNESFTYDFDTGLVLTRTDPNNRTTTINYEDTTLRPKQTTLPTSAFVDYSYDDVAMSTTQTVFTPHTAVCGIFHNSPCKPSVATQKRTSFNGLKLVRETAMLTDGSVFNAVTMEYDALGRLWRRSQPYEVYQPTVPPHKVPPLLWTVFSRDALGRLISVQNPDGSQTVSFYDEANRPSSASKAQGQTVRSVPPYGGDRWYRNDALGQLAEVVEPPAYPSTTGGGCAPHCPPPPQATKDNSRPMPGSAGSVFMDGSVETTYTHNALGLLVMVVQGPAHQERRFRYDLLGRLTAEFLPEKSATLNDAGAYVERARCIPFPSCTAMWSDIFTYDDRSNLTSHTDARGIKAIYDYSSDPLDRLQALHYEFVPDTVDDGSILPSPPATYKYMPSGDVTRLFQVALSRGSDPSWIVQEFGYDTQARVASSKLQHRNQPTLELDYTYDLLDRMIEEIYPTEFGVATLPHKKLDYSYGIGGQLRLFQVDGADYASQLTYNAAGQATSIMIGPAGPQQTIEAYAYDPATALLASQQVQRGSSGLLNIVYHYYPNGQLQQLLEGTGNPEYDYVYDALGRLWSLKKVAGPDGPEWSESYLFDSYGNRTAVAASGQLNGATAPPDGLPSLTYDTTTNHVTNVGFTYDAAGNQTRTQRDDSSWLRYKYDQAGRLAQVTDDDGKMLESYVYGADGKRLVMTNPIGNNYYFWDQNNVIAEYSQPSTQASFSWSKARTYFGGRMLASFVPGSSRELVYYHHPDRLGTRLITDNAGNTATEQATLPFGTVHPSGSSAPINPVFTSYDRSSSTGLDYATYRNYDPQHRFTQVDPLGFAAADLTNPQDLNLYNYVDNDPVNMIDVAGLQSDAGISYTKMGKVVVSGGQAFKSCYSGDLAGCAANLSKMELELYEFSPTAFYQGNMAWVAASGGDPFAAIQWGGQSEMIVENYTINSMTSINGGLESSSVTYVETIVQADVNGASQTSITASNSPDGSSEVTIQSDAGTTVRNTDPQGNQTETVYDQNGNQVSQTTVDINGNPINADPGTGGSGGGCPPSGTRKVSQPRGRRGSRIGAKDMASPCS